MCDVENDPREPWRDPKSRLVQTLNGGNYDVSNLAFGGRNVSRVLSPAASHIAKQAKRGSTGSN
jgi:hypothetical protein